MSNAMLDPNSDDAQGLAAPEGWWKGHQHAMDFILPAVADLQQQIASLRAISRGVLECWPDGDVEGDMLQELAVQHGLLEPQTKTAPCSEESCRCREYYASDELADGINCYRRTALVLGA